MKTYNIFFPFAVAFAFCEACNWDYTAPVPLFLCYPLKNLATHNSYQPPHSHTIYQRRGLQRSERYRMLCQPDNIHDMANGLG